MKKFSARPGQRVDLKHFRRLKSRGYLYVSSFKFVCRSNNF